MRRSGATLLLTWSFLFLPVEARAALDLATLVLDVKTEGTKGVDTLFQVTLTITGTELKTASITQGTTTVPLPCGGSATSCTATPNLTSQAALDALLPTTATSYTITLTGTTDGETVTDTFSFARPAVPSPAISAPVDGSTVDPGALEVTFVACGDCTAATQGVLSQGPTVVETNPSLPASSTSWKPAATLTANSSYGVQITHATGESKGQTADGVGSGTEDDAYVFTNSVTHSDQVAFGTGFAAPTGSFCVVVNDDGSPALQPTTDCVAVVDEPAAGIFDSGDSCATTAAGIPIQYGFQLAANGKLSGIADADLDGDATFETHTQLTGQLKGKEGRLRQKLRMRFGASGAETRFRVRTREEADLAALQGAPVPPLQWLVDQRTRGKSGSAKLAESAMSVRTLPALPSDVIQCAGGAVQTGWKFSFILTGSDGPVSGTLQLANGVDVALSGKQSFDSASNRSELKLDSEGAERGVGIRVKKLEVSAPNQINAGTVRFRAFGQTGGVTLPRTVPTTTTTTTTTTVPTTTSTTTTSTTTTT